MPICPYENIYLVQVYKLVLVSVEHMAKPFASPSLKGAATFRDENKCDGYGNTFDEDEYRTVGYESKFRQSTHEATTSSSMGRHRST